MKKIIALTLLLSVLTSSACDICGCYMGLTPYRNFSTLGVFYRYRAFNGYSSAGQSHQAFPSSVFRTTHGEESHGNTSDSTLSNDDYEIYRAYELRGKWFIHPRVELNFILPYAMNSYKQNGVRTSMSGISDMSLFGGYHLIQQQDDPVFKQRLVLGLGSKLGTGRYQLADSLNFRRDPMMQPGTGSLDALTYANYFFMYRNIGFSSNLMYKMNSRNIYEERIGNSVTTYTNIFYLITAGKTQIVPMAQVYHEYTRGMRKRDKWLEGTGMNEVLLGPGLDFYFKGLLINTSFQWNLYSKISEGNMGSAGRMVMGVSYNIVQKKFWVD